MDDDGVAPTPEETERIRSLLCAMQDEIQARVTDARHRRSSRELSAIDAVTPSDTLYEIDRVGEEALLAWFEAHWPEAWPVELILEGETAAPGETPRVPRGAPDEALRFTCIIDPIDGTRSLMHDKRSAWVLSAVAPRPRRRRPRLRDTFVAAMTELPPTKQPLADQLSAVRGGGRAGLRAERVDLRSGERRSFVPEPSTAIDLRHGFASFARFFPEGKALMAAFEEQLWERLYGPPGDGAPLIFDDQYICTGGQFYELLVGHDRLLGDLRPLAYAALGRSRSIQCHPYDACTALILEEAGCRITAPNGATLDFPLDTLTPVAWVGFANAALEAHVRPALDAALRTSFGV
jgi:fructose-1,6-bisphosphatase/inositol monophosphatase family enzyme